MYRIQDTGNAGYWIIEIDYTMSYRKLEIWQEAKEISVMIHEMTLTLPRFEQFEEAQQIRRSSKSVRSNIVEGYERRRYKSDFIRFLIIAQASNDETIDHLETLFETKSLTDQTLYEKLNNGLQKLGRKISNFIKAVEKEHNTNQVDEPEANYYNQISRDQYPESGNPAHGSSIQYPES